MIGHSLGRIDQLKTQENITQIRVPVEQTLPTFYSICMSMEEHTWPLKPLHKTENRGLQIGVLHSKILW